MASLYSETSQYKKALELATKSLEQARQAKDAEEITARKLLLAEIFKESGDYAIAVEIASEVRQIAVDENDQLTLFHSLLQLADYAYELDNNQKACIELIEAENVASTAGYQQGIAASLSLRARILIDSDQAEISLVLLKRAVEIFQNTGDLHGQAGGNFHTAIAHLALGKVEQSRALALLAIKQYESIQSKTAEVVKDWFDNRDEFQHSGESDE